MDNSINSYTIFQVTAQQVVWVRIEGHLEQSVAEIGYWYHDYKGRDGRQAGSSLVIWEY